MNIDKEEIKILKESGEQTAPRVIFYFILSGTAFAFSYINRDISDFAPIVLFASGLLLGLGIEKLYSRRVRIAAHKLYRAFFEAPDEND